MEIKFLFETDDEKWNVFVDQSKQGSLFCKTWFLKSLGLSYKILIVVENNEIYGGIILSKWHGLWTFGPMQKYNGILFSSFNGSKYNVVTLQRSVTRLIIEKLIHLKSFDYYFHPEYSDWLLFYQSGFKEITYYTYRLDLENFDDEKLIENCSPKLRPIIRKAVKDDSIEILHENDPEFFYNLNNKTFKKQGGNIPISMNRFLSIYSALKEKNCIKLYSCKNKNGNKTAVLGSVYDNRSAYLMFSGFDPESKENGHNELLIYTAILEAKKSVNMFDFEGSMLTGVESFYRKFGGIMTPYFRIYKPGSINTLKHHSIKYYKKFTYGK